ncbi:MAG: Lrp/AsnC ligand binding domain-containing protein, partial [Pseudomonadales bacterium]
EMDFLVRIVTQDIQSYERFFFEILSQLPGVQEVHSNIAMSEMKSTTALPLTR